MTGLVVAYIKKGPLLGELNVTNPTWKYSSYNKNKDGLMI